MLSFNSSTVTLNLKSPFHGEEEVRTGHFALREKVPLNPSPFHGALLSTLPGSTRKDICFLRVPPLIPSGDYPLICDLPRPKRVVHEKQENGNKLKMMRH